ncbi:MAG: DUF4097 domain-containing protein [Clostridiales bacterium]|nr:DUF4097 domain-containing protein [Clostridiales bacterium]
MKRTGKILAVGVAALLAGVIVWIVGMSIIDWDFTRLDSTTYTAQSYECEDEIKSISVNLSSFPLTVTKGDSVALDYYEADNSEVFVEENNGVLSVVEKYKYNPFKSGIFDFGRHSHKFALTVVSGVTFEINGLNGDISFDGVSFDEFSINSTNANIGFTNVEFGKLNIDVTNGDIEFKDCRVGELTIVGKNTHCEFDRLTADSTSVNTVNANIDIEDCKIQDLFVDATNLDITSENSEFKSFVIDGTNTDCDLKKVTLDKLSIDTVNLGAYIEIVGNESEYTVRTDGRNMPHDRTGTTDKLIELSGTNNSVKLKFV